MGAHAVPSVQYGMVGKLEADWAAIEVVFRVIRKLTAYECTCPATRVVLCWLPAILPGAVKIDLMTRSSMYRCVVGIVSIGHELF